MNYITSYTNMCIITNDLHPVYKVVDQVFDTISEPFHISSHVPSLYFSFSLSLTSPIETTITI